MARASLENLAVDSYDAITVEQSSPSRGRIGGNIPDDDPAMLEPRHEAKRRDSQNIAGDEEREVPDVDGAGKCDASADEMFRSRRVGTGAGR